MQTILSKPPSAPRASSSVLHRVKGLILASLLRRFDASMVIRHPLSGTRFRLRSLSDRRYWLSLRRKAPKMARRLASLIQRGDVVFDVGAGNGYFSIAGLTRVGDFGEVHIFEPGLRHLRDLRGNVAGKANVTVIASAVSDRIGKMPFADRPDIGSSPARALAVLRQVWTTTLDGYAAQHGLRPAVLRINVPDEALRILRGANRTLGQVRTVWVNVSRDRDEIFALLTDAGFQLETLGGQAIDRAMGCVDTVIARR